MTVSGPGNELFRPAQNLSDTLNFPPGAYDRFQPCKKPVILPESNRLPADSALKVSISCADQAAEIRYTLDGSIPGQSSALYTGPFSITGAAIIKAIAFSGARIPSSMVTKHYSKSYPVKKVKYLNPVSVKYPGSKGDMSLVDGQFGTENFYDSNWQGIEVLDFNLVLDLGQTRNVHNVSFSCLVNNGGWIYAPARTEISFSDDGSNFKKGLMQDCQAQEKADEMQIKTYSYNFASVPARFVHLKLKNIGNNPAWHSNPGGKAWLFLDEVSVK